MVSDLLDLLMSPFIELVIVVILILSEPRLQNFRIYRIKVALLSVLYLNNYQRLLVNFEQVL
jgi:hypothetical protein